MASPAVLIRAERTCLAKPDTAPRTQVAQQVGCSALRMSHARNPHARTTRCPPAALPGSVPRRTKNRRSALHAPERRAAHCRLRTRFGCRLIAHLGTPPGLARPRRKFRHKNPMHQGSGPPRAAQAGRLRGVKKSARRTSCTRTTASRCTKPATARNPRLHETRDARLCLPYRQRDAHETGRSEPRRAACGTVPSHATESHRKRNETIMRRARRPSPSPQSPNLQRRSDVASVPVAPRPATARQHPGWPCPAEPRRHTLENDVCRMSP